MNYPITVPRPCFITVTRSEEIPQIEFTYQISFEGSIARHRTYRELSSDGKVLRACRAIYTGNGGVAANQNSAGIYFHAQEWDWVLGVGTFTGVCSRNTSSLVGKSFQFQFVSGGMVKSQSGTIFNFRNKTSGRRESFPVISTKCASSWS